MAKVIKFPKRHKHEAILSPQPSELTDFELMAELYIITDAFTHYDDDRRMRARDIYWQLYDRLLINK